MLAQEGRTLTLVPAADGVAAAPSSDGSREVIRSNCTYVQHLCKTQQGRSITADRYSSRTRSLSVLCFTCKGYAAATF
jgi:hypothetical protein